MPPGRPALRHLTRRAPLPSKEKRRGGRRPYLPLPLPVNDGGRAAAALDVELPRPGAKRTRTSAGVMAPSRTAMCLPYTTRRSPRARRARRYRPLRARQRCRRSLPAPPASPRWLPLVRRARAEARNNDGPRRPRREAGGPVAPPVSCRRLRCTRRRTGSGRHARRVPSRRRPTALPRGGAARRGVPAVKYSAGHRFLIRV